MEWIKCSERRPEPFKEVLICAKDKMNWTFNSGEKYLAVDRMCKWQDGYKDSFRTERFDYGEVIAWMDLPEMPKED